MSGSKTDTFTLMGGPSDGQEITLDCKWDGRGFGPADRPIIVEGEIYRCMFFDAGRKRWYEIHHRDYEEPEQSIWDWLKGLFI